ncbi:hypothetical protein BGZ79_003700 [Entomortierella chlamydospora]|nr:hypothetical protein BGZ79_003700 [Entomortierella chlamydospora]
MSTSNEIFDPEKSPNNMAANSMRRQSRQQMNQQFQHQRQQQQQFPLHAHLEPEDVGPFHMDQMDVGMNTTFRTTAPMPNPGPFGLCAFALTAFCMGFYNLRAGINPNSPANALTGTTLFYGGLGQIIAGLLEYRNGSTFGGTTFCSYGIYWISYATLLIPSFGVTAAYADYPDDYTTTVGIYSLAWTIFTFLMWTLTWRSNLASSLVFFCLGMTYLLGTVSTLAHLEPGNIVQRASGGIGIITSCIAWYCAMADLSNSQNSYYTLPLGQLGRR